MIRNVDGDSREGIEDYYRNSVIEIRNAINAKSEEYILNSELEELTKYHIHEYLLPTIQVDSSRKDILEKEQSTSGRYGGTYVTLKIGIPIILEENIDKVISHHANPYLMNVNFSLENGYLITSVQVPTNSQNVESRVQNELETLKTIIEQKNFNVRNGNPKLEQEIRNFISQRKEGLSQENRFVESIAEKLPIELIKKENAPIVPNLKVREKIKPVIPTTKKMREPYLEKEKVDAVIELIRNQGRQFEVTPSVYSKMGETELRDVILGMLNAVFKGGATGESFVKKGKTDIHLKLDIEGDVLSSECKFWEGEKLYKTTIDQHFDYLTWKQNYAIQITFSRNKGFSDVINNAIKAAKEHPTYVSNSFKQISTNYFLTSNTFPSDSKKQIEIHHLIFDLSI
jgi:hypothetical protein